MVAALVKSKSFNCKAIQSTIHLLPFKFLYLFISYFCQVCRQIQLEHHKGPCKCSCQQSVENCSSHQVLYVHISIYIVPSTYDSRFGMKTLVSVDVLEQTVWPNTAVLWTPIDIGMMRLVCVFVR